MTASPLPRTLLCAAALVAAACAAQAGAIYKIVGPDGKVTFTDHPPTVAPAPGASAPKAGAGGSTVTRGGSADGPGGDAASLVANSSLVPASQKELFVALVLAESFRETLQQADAICVTGAATPNKNFRVATIAWKQRNQEFYNRVDRVMGGALQTAQRQFVVEQVSRIVDKELDPIRSANVPARMQWCDRSAMEVGSGKMDVSRMPAMAKALQGGGGNGL